jgi:hypothetical protein
MELQGDIILGSTGPPPDWFGPCLSIFMGPLFTWAAWGIYKQGECGSLGSATSSAYTWTRKNEPFRFWCVVVFFGTFGVLGWLAIFWRILSWFGLVDKPQF